MLEEGEFAASVADETAGGWVGADDGADGVAVFHGAERSLGLVAPGRLQNGHGGGTMRQVEGGGTKGALGREGKSPGESWRGRGGSVARLGWI